MVFSQFAIEDCLFKLVMVDLPLNNGDFSVRKLLLVGGFKHCFFSVIYGIILPIDELIFFRGVGIPPPRLVCRRVAEPCQTLQSLENPRVHFVGFTAGKVIKLPSGKHTKTMENHHV